MKKLGAQMKCKRHDAGRSAELGKRGMIQEAEVHANRRDAVIKSWAGLPGTRGVVKMYTRRAAPTCLQLFWAPVWRHDSLGLTSGKSTASPHQIPSTNSTPPKGNLGIHSTATELESISNTAEDYCPSPTTLSQARARRNSVSLGTTRVLVLRMAGGMGRSLAVTPVLARVLSVPAVVDSISSPFPTSRSRS